MCVAQTCKRRRRQLRLTAISRNRTSTAKKRWDEAKFGSNSVAKKRKK